MLEFERMISVVDAHAAGEPLRIVTSGLPQIPGETILQRRQYFLQHMDHIRRFLMHEPRGHSGMYGCIITPPASTDGDFGILFMHNEGYSTMCGHGIIAATKVACQMGIVQKKREIRIDSPAGRIVAQVHGDGQSVDQVSFINVPSFVYARDQVLRVNGSQVKVDVAFGGAFYSFVRVQDTGLTLDLENLPRLVDMGMQIKRATMDEIDVIHPLEPELAGIYGTIITEPTRRDGHTLVSRNLTVFADAQVDRSPTGTGTAARLALLHEKDQMTENDELYNSSIIDTKFTGRITGTSSVGRFPAVIPEIRGSAQIMGLGQLVLERGDPLPGGFRLTT